MNNLHQELKEFIIETMNLEDITAAEIGDEMPLFGDEGLGLDSIDALELVLALKKKYQVVLEANDPATRENLASVAALARLINSRQA
ncbi:MAG: acyl carrier protein [Dechloromonas sp.]|jgi:acyl carrier protein|uniref:Acyl carrier protein n=1 Tax=Candidatus Dechloromonas phosphorivorans TaxID=2899244 RepID=A0A935JXF9_9RHOO|nr:acyl carrier protein [Candidatus Dechloromonas phosphorivorans]